MSKVFKRARVGHIQHEWILKPEDTILYGWKVDATDTIDADATETTETPQTTE